MALPALPRSLATAGRHQHTSDDHRRDDARGSHHSAAPRQRQAVAVRDEDDRRDCRRDAEERAIATRSAHSAGAMQPSAATHQPTGALIERCERAAATPTRARTAIRPHSRL